MKIVLPPTKAPENDGVNVIELSLYRGTRYGRQLDKKCSHRKVLVDTSLTNLECEDCKQMVNPVEWLASMIEEWERVKHLTDKYNEAAENYRAKTRCRCEHCDKMTKIRPPTPAEVREFKRKEKEQA